MSLTENISPVLQLLSIEKSCPELPSNKSELSVRTDKVIGEPVVPIKAKDGLVRIPVNPIDA